MNKGFLIAAIGAVVLFAVSFSCFAEIVDKILVVVNDEVITQREVDRKIAPLYYKFKALYEKEMFFRKISEARSRAVEDLVKTKLILSEAKRRGVEVLDEELAERINAVKAQFASDEEFYIALEDQGISFSELEENYRQSMMTEKLVEQHIGQKISINPQEMFAYYEEHKSELNEPEKARVRSIMIKISFDRDRETALYLAKDIAFRLQNGEDFAELAKLCSDGICAREGGDRGYVRKGEMIPELDETIFSLEEGQTSDVVETKLGFHIFRVEEKVVPEIPEFKDVSQNIERILYRVKMGGRIEEFIEELKENAYIEFK